MTPRRQVVAVIPVPWRLGKYSDIPAKADARKDERLKGPAVFCALREFLRPDGSAHPIVMFDPETGERTGARGGQGCAPKQVVY